MGDAAARRIVVAPAALAARAYEVVVGAGLLDTCAELIAQRCPAHRYAVITDDRVEALYAPGMCNVLAAAGMRTDVFSFPPGEARKTRVTWAEVTDAMLAAGIGRDAAVIALGGGVVGDLAGFVAATYMRGLPVVQVPTTLLAMIDASVGGKTGVDTPSGKNLVGAFHQPVVVLADPSVLRTLPDAHLRAGLAEAVKHGAIADEAYLDWIAQSAPQLLAGDTEALQQLIVRSVEIKADIVAQDERESGPRKALNFGHTIGHAVESASDYTLLHGVAVAIGMVVEAQIGEELGITESGTAERLSGLLADLGLPVDVPARYAADEIVEWTHADKKARAGQAEYALIERVGKAAFLPDAGWAVPVADDLVRNLLAARKGPGAQLRQTALRPS